MDVKTACISGPFSDSEWKEIEDLIQVIERRDPSRPRYVVEVVDVNEPSSDTMPPTLADMFALAQRTSPRLCGTVPAFTERELTPSEEALTASLLRERLANLLSRCAAELWMERGASHLLNADEVLAYGMVVGQLERAARVMRPLIEGVVSSAV